MRTKAAATVACLAAILIAATASGAPAATAWANPQTSVRTAQSDAAAPRVVATVDGTPITRARFDHWMYVAAMGNAAASRSKKPVPVIVPTDPPTFAGCIAQVRAQLPALASTPDAKVRQDCAQLFRALGSQVLGFLILADWYVDYSKQLHIVVTNAEVHHALVVARRRSFKTPAAFKVFLKTTGQSVKDVLFRVRINLIYQRLNAVVHNKRKLLSIVTKLYRSVTSCRASYAMADCVKNAAP
jgi:hypothetical protein